MDVAGEAGVGQARPGGRVRAGRSIREGMEGGEPNEKQPTLVIFFLAVPVVWARARTLVLPRACPVPPSSRHTHTMPVVSVPRDKLFVALGRTYSELNEEKNGAPSIGPPAFCPSRPADLPSHAPHFLSLTHAADEEFHLLCFDYGIELDDVVS